MYKYPITIELLSETIFGNGQSKNGIVNTDVLLDEEGFPYYLGKSFKGCLKKSINTILKPYYSYKNKDQFSESVNKLFGSINNKDDIEEQNEGVLKFTNFYLDKNIRNIFNNCEIIDGENEKKDLILSSLTDIRFGIKMGEEGISESKSLRASRILRKGLVFKGFICSSSKLEGLDLTLLEKGIKSLKNLGVNKSRGKGLVNVEIGEIVQIYSKNIEDINYDFNYLLYEINLKEPVKIGDSQSQYDYEQTKSYISGSMVRGAVISKYLKSKGINPKEAEKDAYFNDLLKKVCFYDSYPIYENDSKIYYSFPTPNIFRITKDIDKEERSFYENDEFLTVFDKGKINNEPTVKKLKKGDFSYYEDNTLYQFNVKKDYRFHHSQQMEKENIFRYESISKGQKFYGVVDVSHINEYLKREIYNLLEKEEILYLGGSRTSGYGQTEIFRIKPVKDFNKLQEELGYIKDNGAEDKLNIYFLSDTILRDENHQIVSCFSEKYLNKELNINISKGDIEMDINPVILTGYNSKWRSFISHVYGLEKGSVIRVNLDKSSNKTNKNIIDNFIKIQKGDRKQDGLGRVIVNPKFLDVNKIGYLGTNKVHNYERQDSDCNLSNELIEYLKQCRNRVIIDKCIKTNTVNELSKSSGIKILNNISNSKINNIISVIDRALLCEEKNPMDEVKNEIERLNKVTQNKERNENNYEILNCELLEKKSLKELARLNKEKINEIVKYILSQGLKLSDSIKEDTIKEIMENDSKDEFRNERILLNTIRNIFYYSIKSKEGEHVG